MTIREIIETCRDGTENWPMEAIISVAGAIRSTEQMESSTFEGDILGLEGWMSRYGKPTPESVQKFIDECPNLMEMQISDKVLLDWAYDNQQEQKE